MAIYLFFYPYLQFFYQIRIIYYCVSVSHKLLVKCGKVQGKFGEDMHKLLSPVLQTEFCNGPNSFYLHDIGPGPEKGAVLARVCLWEG